MACFQIPIAHCSERNIKGCRKGLFRPHCVAWFEQQRIGSHGPQYLRNVIQFITETGLRIYKQLTSMRKNQVDLQNVVVRISDSKTPNGIAVVPLLRSPLKHSKVRWRLLVKDRFYFRAIGIREGTRRASKLFGEKLFDAQEMGRNYFDLGKKGWKIADYFGDTWVADRAFLDAAIARGSQFHLNQPPLGKYATGTLSKRSGILI
jgi:hypothetical protein